MADLFERPEFPGSPVRVSLENGSIVTGRVRHEAASLLVRDGKHEGQLETKAQGKMAVSLEDGVYTFPTVLYMWNEALREYWFTAPKSSVVMREQRRSYVRVPVDIPAVLFVSDEGAAIPCRMLDVSGGGALLRSPTHFEQDAIIGVEFTLKGVTQRVRAAVIRSDAAKQHLAVMFLDIKPTIRDRIVGFCFREQAKQRKRK